MNDHLFAVLHDIGLARSYLDEALTAVYAIDKDNRFSEIAVDYIMEANARFLYAAEKKLNEAVVHERSPKP